MGYYYFSPRTGLGLFVGSLRGLVNDLGFLSGFRVFGFQGLGS